jgi:hypothetical protein
MPQEAVIASRLRIDFYSRSVMLRLISSYADQAGFQIVIVVRHLMLIDQLGRLVPLSQS